MGMTADGYYLSFPQLGAVSGSGFDEGWGYEETQSGTMWLGCVSCKPKESFEKFQNESIERKSLEKFQN